MKHKIILILRCYLLIKNVITNTKLCVCVPLYRFQKVFSQNTYNVIFETRVAIYFAYPSLNVFYFLFVITLAINFRKKCV